MSHQTPRGTLHEHLRTFMIIRRSIPLEREMFQTKVVETIKTKILCSLKFFVTRAVL